jgi:nucleoside-diphosphate-sugar epimerase
MLLSRVLITGAHGFLGSHLVEALEDRRFVGVLKPTSAELDLREKHETQAYFADCRPDFVFHLAATVGGIGANQRRPGTFFYDNMTMGLNVIEAAARGNVKKLIIVGTVCGYPKVPPHIPFVEEDLWAGYPEETNAAYGIAKKALLVMGQAYRQEFGFHVIHLIPTNLYGPRDHFDPSISHVIPAMISAFEEAKHAKRNVVTFWGDGTPTREFLYAADCAQGLLRAAEIYDGPAPINLGSGREISVRDLAGKIGELVGWRGEICWDKSKPNGQPRRALCTKRALRELDWTATTSLEDGLKATVEWYESVKYRPQMGRRI